MWIKSTFYVGVIALSLAIIAKNQFWGTGSTIALDIILAGMAAACVAALRELWKSS